MTDTGQDKEVVGVPCNIFSSAQLGQGCYTDDWIMLEQSVMGSIQTATKVDLDSGGDDANYNRHKQGDVTESNAPDISQILDMMGQQ